VSLALLLCVPLCLCTPLTLPNLLALRFCNPSSTPPSSSSSVLLTLPTANSQVFPGWEAYEHVRNILRLALALKNSNANTSATNSSASSPAPAPTTQALR
jgi:hypothetical protein